MKYWIFFIPAIAFAQARSGLDYSSDEIRKLQANDAENPGMLWVDRGAALFAKDCASCHRDEVKGMAAKFPRREQGKVVTLEQKVKHLKPSMAHESEEMLSLTAFLAHASRGRPLNPGISGSEKGRAEYFRRRGQMNLACAHCHDDNAGKRIGTETISQGQPNGFPAYRLEWQKLGSLQRRLRACFFGLHAELPAYGSDLLNELELYLAWRAKGLPIESPAVRR